MEIVIQRLAGNGPKDFNRKKTWLENGWQPYSIAQKNEDGSITYKQYNRIDPRFYDYGIIADMNENSLITLMMKLNKIFLLLQFNV